MSYKQEVKKYIVDRFRKDVDYVLMDEETRNEARRHIRNIDAYVTNTLNLKKDGKEAAHGLTPSLFTMLTNGPQHLSIYNENYVSDLPVKHAFAFKMLIGK